MIIWKGHGILILVFGVLGAVAMSAVVVAAAAVTHWGWIARLMLCAPLWGAAGAIWLYAKMIGKTVEKTYLDPTTRQPVVLRSSHSLFFIPPVPLAIIATVLACLASLSIFVRPPSLEGGGAGRTDGEAAFQDANRLIGSDHGTEAYGNTPEAEKLAADFAAGVKLGRQLGVEAGKKPAISLSNGKFLTYCRLNADSCAFMVHVPDLRKFSQDAKDYMADLAWGVAMKQAAQLRPQPRRLAVGIRGALLYDIVLEGQVQAAEKAGDGIEQRHSGFSPEKFLAAYFEPPAAEQPQPAPDTKADGPSAPKTVASTDAPTAPNMAPPSAPGMGPSGTPSVGGPNAVHRSSFNSVPRPAPSAPPAPETLRQMDEEIRQFVALRSGEAAGNSPAAKDLATTFAEVVHTSLPPAATLGAPMPSFSSCVHLRQDSAVFMLGLTSAGAMRPGSDMIVLMKAFQTARQAAAQMTPVPTKLAVMLFKGGQLAAARTAVNTNPTSAIYHSDRELRGENSREALAPFFQSFTGGMITMREPLQSLPNGPNRMPPGARPQNKAAAKAPAKRAASSDPAAPPPEVGSAAAMPAPKLPTQLRDWKDTTGRVMNATLESFTSPACDTGHFKRADGQGFDVPVARLSAEDQEYIRKILVK